MGLLENQIQAAITIQNGEAAISTSVDMLAREYGLLNPLGEELFKGHLIKLVNVCKELGAFNEFHQTHLRNG